MDEEELRSLWLLELPSILGVAAPGAEVLDEGDSVSFDVEYDSPEEARYEQEAIAEDSDHDRLMASSTDSESCSAPSTPMNYEILWPHLSPQNCYNTLMPPSVDLDCFQPRTRLEADAKKALSQGMVPGDILARLTEELPSSLRAVHGDPPFRVQTSS